MEIVKVVTPKVVAATYERWSFMTGLNCRMGKFLVFWISGLLGEIVAYERCSNMEVRLYHL